MRTILPLLLLVSGCTKDMNDTASPSTMKDAEQVADFILVLGQSNADGRCTADRMVNQAWAYEGISALPISQRTNQQPYGFDATDIHTYWKTSCAADDQSLDDGSWQPYVIGVNSARSCANASKNIGPEFSMARKIIDATGRPVYVMKAAFAGTPLCPGVAALYPPGRWNNTNREIAIQYVVARGLRDFRASNPGTRCRLAGAVWWQGESDAMASISTSTYQSNLNGLFGYITAGTDTLFDNTTAEPTQWNLIGLGFYRNAKEDAINAALQNVANANTGFHYVNSRPYPRGVSLTTSQASPIPRGTPNSAGGNDNQHASHIAELAVGELCAQNVIAAGWIVP